ncbi:MAG: DUF2382 domain-containing protein [Stenomitos frigidus ULC029]
MALFKVKDFDPDYRKHFDNSDIVGFDLYSAKEKVGTVDDLLVDEQGSFRYLVVSTGAWIFGKKVLLPIGRSRISYSDHRVYADGLTKTQVENLPEFDENATIDYHQEERIRNVYRSAPPLGTVPVDNPASAPVAYDPNSYSYQQEPALYNMNEQDHQNFKLYEERLIASKTRAKTGEVTVGKRVETETSKVSVPIDKERVVIERTTPTDAGTAVTPAAEAFQEGEVARLDVYEETPDIRKEAFVREEISVRKEVDHDTVNAEETLRREELDIDTDGNPVVDKGTKQQRRT